MSLVSLLCDVAVKIGALFTQHIHQSGLNQDSIWICVPQTAKTSHVIESMRLRDTGHVTKNKAVPSHSSVYTCIHVRTLICWTSNGN